MASVNPMNLASPEYDAVNLSSPVVQVSTEHRPVLTATLQATFASVEVMSTVPVGTSPDQPRR